jgi:hypothetical protein
MLGHAERHPRYRRRSRNNSAYDEVGPGVVNRPGRKFVAIRSAAGTNPAATLASSSAHCLIVAYTAADSSARP